MPYPFLLSYARKNALTLENEPDPHFKAFLKRLNERVHHHTNAVGFVDQTEIKVGQEWPDELAEALRTAESMVCLCSPAYFGSVYCGKEMQVMLDRRQEFIRQRGGKKPANIIFVPWHSTRWHKPRTLPDFQYKQSKLDENKYGVWDLGDQGLHNDLSAFADDIAFRIRDAIEETPLPPLAERPNIKAVPNAFEPPPLPLREFDEDDVPRGPGSVTFVYAGPRKWNAWPWGPPDQRAVLHLASAVAKGKEMKPSQLTFDLAAGDLGKRLAALHASNNVVVLLLDAASLDDAGFAPCIAAYDQPQHDHFATIVIDGNANDPVLDAKLRTALPTMARRAAPHLSFVDDRFKFSDVVETTLETLRLFVLAKAKAQNPAAAAAARSLPIVGGPGGNP